MAAAAADRPQDMALVAVFPAKVIPVHQAVIIGQGMVVEVHLRQVLVCKPEGVLLAQSQVLV
jgi:hypothetical protein